MVYNHFTPNAERAEWGYDTNDVVKNPYYWYEGVPSDYPAYQRAVAADARDLGGYVDNMSTGFAPRFYEEMVRKMFISSAVMLDGGIPRRRVPRRPDDVDPLLQRTAR